MEIVNRLLGYNNLQTTQDHYSKVAHRKVSMVIERLKGGGDVLPYKFTLIHPLV